MVCIMKMNHCVQFHGLHIMEITRLDRFLWFVYNENEPMRAISWFIYNGNYTTGPFSMVCI